MRYLFICLLTGLLLACKNDRQTDVASPTTTGHPAIDGLTALLQKQPEADHLYVDRAKLFYENSAFDEAITDMERAIRIDSLNPAYYHLLSDIYMDYYKSRRALRTMEKAGRLFPERIPTLLKLSEVQFFLKQYQPSLMTINDVLKTDPQNAEAYFMLGMNFREMGDTIRAINSFQTATEFDPELLDAWIILGDMHDQIGNDRALTFYENAIRVDPTNIVAIHSKAFFLQNHDRIPEAIELYQRINQLDPQYGDAYLNTGILFLELDSVDQAHEHFNIFAGIEPANYLAFYYRGLAQELRGNTANALSDYESAYNLQPDSERVNDALERIRSKVDSES